MNATRQLPLDLPATSAQGREDFLVSPSNENAYALIDGWPVWPQGGALIIGPPGAGKSHLAAIWAGTAGAGTIAAEELGCHELPGVLASGALVVEDIDRGAVPEAPLFHLLNLARETATALLLTARSLPVSWPIRTPDLASRLRAMCATAIDPPDEPLLRALLVKLFVDRQLVVDTSVVDYLMPRLDRSFEAVRAAVAALDAEALARNRRITRATVADVLAALAPGDTSDT